MFRGHVIMFYSLHLFPELEYCAMLRTVHKSIHLSFSPTAAHNLIKAIRDEPVE